MSRAKSPIASSMHESNQTPTREPGEASPLVRESMTRLLSGSPRGFTEAQRMALDGFSGKLQSGHPSDQMLEEDRMPMTDVIKAHQHASHHRSAILASQSCGCFHCLAVFAPDLIITWVDSPQGTPKDQKSERGATATCPHCGIDAVIGSTSGLPITREFLVAMQAHWFRS